jgi:hypothetical protein
LLPFDGKYLGQEVYALSVRQDDGLEAGPLGSVVAWRLAKEWNLGSFHSVNFSDWKHVRFHSMALSDGLLLQILPVCEVDGLVARTYHSVSRYRWTVSTVTFSPRS